MSVIVILGNPVEGFRFYGPFDDHDEGEQWIVDQLAGDATAWTAELVSADPTDIETIDDLATLLPIDDPS